MILGGQTVMASITPTIFLKGLDPQEIYRLYRESGHLQATPSKQQFAVDAVIPTLTERNEPDSAIRVRLNNNCIYTIIATSGYVKYNYFKEHGERLKGGTCWVCKERFEEVTMGYIVHYSKQIVDTPRGKRNVHIFWDGEGEFCSFECCLSYTILLSSKSFPCKEALCFSSETSLRYLYSLVTGNPPDSLVAANSPFLLSSNGGSLDRNEWKRHRYSPTAGVILFPAMHEYLCAAVQPRTSNSHISEVPSPKRTVK